AGGENGGGGAGGGRSVGDESRGGGLISLLGESDPALSLFRRCASPMRHGASEMLTTSPGIQEVVRSIPTLTPAAVSLSLSLLPLVAWNF
ncbi:unnamed protein product, partial [Lampetra planeri]